MLNGAEPVRATTLRSFATHFAACGLRLEALAPGYGMAETCILVSVNAVRPPTIIRVDTSTLFVEGNVVILDGIVESGDGITSELVGCGHALCCRTFHTLHAASQLLAPGSSRRGACLALGP